MKRKTRQLTLFFFLELINLQWQNSIHDICFNQTEFCEKLKTFFTIQLDWIYDQINSNPNDEYWHQVFEEGNSFYQLISIDLDQFIACSIEWSD